jgi:hypothetical protein
MGSEAVLHVCDDHGSKCAVHPNRETPVGPEGRFVAAHALAFGEPSSSCTVARVPAGPRVRAYRIVTCRRLSAADTQLTDRASGTASNSGCPRFKARLCFPQSLQGCLALACQLMAIAFALKMKAVRSHTVALTFQTTRCQPKNTEM